MVASLMTSNIAPQHPGDCPEREVKWIHFIDFAATFAEACRISSTTVLC
jgi:hypothetical protein